MTTGGPDMKPAMEHAPTSLKEQVLLRAYQREAELQREREDPAFHIQREAERDAKAAEAKRLHEQEQAAARGPYLTSCGVGDRERDLLLEGLSADASKWPCVKLVREWWKNPRQCLLLQYGASGTGKTAAACEPFLELHLTYDHPDFGKTRAYPAVPSQRPKYVVAGDLATGSSFGERAERTFNALTRYRYLVIDELGMEVMTAPWLSLLERIVVERHRYKRKTALLGNCDLDTFKKRYGETDKAEGRIMRRVRTDGLMINAGAARRLPGL